MARLVVFNGRAHKLPNDSMKADPVPGVWYVGESPRHLPDAIPRFTERVFDRALAEHCGRTCGPDCDGDCFAELYVAVANINDARAAGRQKDEQLFDCLPVPEAAAAAEHPMSPAMQDTELTVEDAQALRQFVDAPDQSPTEAITEPEPPPAAADDTPEAPDDAATPQGVSNA